MPAAATRSGMNPTRATGNKTASRRRRHRPRDRRRRPRGALLARVRLDVGAGTLIAFATAPGKVALDGEGANSPFSAALSRHIGTPDLEVQQMLTRVRAEVVAATKSHLAEKP